MTGSDQHRSAGRPFTVLFLCTGNSARSILAEALMNHHEAGRMRAFSAGSHPVGAVHPLALDLLRAAGLTSEALRSKGWDEFVGSDAPELDAVITVCDRAAGEICPIWPGHPVTAHWGLPDPTAVTGPEAACRAAFRQTFEALEGRIRAFIEALPNGADTDDMKNTLRENP